MSDTERKKHLTGIDEHGKHIDRSQRALRMHLKSLFGEELFNDDGDNTDDPLLVEGEVYGEMSMMVEELKQLALEAGELAST